MPAMWSADQCCGPKLKPVPEAIFGGGRLTRHDLPGLAVLFRRPISLTIRIARGGSHRPHKLTSDSGKREFARQGSRADTLGTRRPSLLSALTQTGPVQGLCFGRQLFESVEFSPHQRFRRVLTDVESSIFWNSPSGNLRRPRLSVTPMARLHVNCIILALSSAGALFATPNRGRHVLHVDNNGTVVLAVRRCRTHKRWDRRRGRRVSCLRRRWQWVFFWAGRNRNRRANTGQ
jgi:hypothetical protein